MRDDGRWSLTIVRIKGVPVRVHIFFGLFVAWTLFFAWREEQGPGYQGNLVAIAAACLTILAVSVVLHELAHLLVALRTGGRYQEITIGPFGGMSRMDVAPEPKREALIYLAGPLCNASIAMLLAGVLFSLDSFSWHLLNPLRPLTVADGPWPIVLAKLVVWVNWVLVLLNIIPAFPFDGGRALRAAILWHSPLLGRREASRWVIRLARLIASVMAVGAVFSMRDDAGLIALALLALVVFLGSEHEHEAAVESARTLPKTPTPQPMPPPRSIYPSALTSIGEASAHGDAHHDTVLRARRAKESEPADDVDEQRVDEILMRVHEHGMASLSDEERAVLERASRRYRERVCRRDA
jgi:stage IV sporulation protein FB